MQNMINDYKGKINTLESLLGESKSKTEQLERELREVLSRSKETEDNHLRVLSMLRNGSILNTTASRRSKASNRRNTRGSTSADRQFRDLKTNVYTHDTMDSKQQDSKLRTKKMVRNTDKDIMLMNP